jgi:cytochrome c
MTMNKVMAFVALAVFASASAMAADGAKLYAEKTCSACHGKDGKKTLMPDYPKIAGQNKAYVLKQMVDIKSGARANGNSAAMKGVMVIVTDDEMKALADFVSQMKP